MSSPSIATLQRASSSERYRERERALWDYYGLAHTERFVSVGTPRVRLRVVEVGLGEPILFVPGTAGVGPSWGALVAQLAGYRLIMLDRPGWGLSEPGTFSQHEYRRVVVDTLRGVLDELRLDRAHVIGASVGGNWALRLAQAEPARVRRLVLLGAGPLTDELDPPPFFRLFVTPIGALMVRLPSNPKRVRSILRGLGHGASLDAGRIPDAYIDWRVAFDNFTDSMRNEREMVRTMVARGRWRPGITVSANELRQIQAPTLFVFGTGDPTGSADVWARFVGHLPNGRLMVIDEAGHLPWLDAPEQLGSQVRAFLGEAD